MHTASNYRKAAERTRKIDFDDSAAPSQDEIVICTRKLRALASGEKQPKYASQSKEPQSKKRNRKSSSSSRSSKKGKHLDHDSDPEDEADSEPDSILDSEPDETDSEPSLVSLASHNKPDAETALQLDVPRQNPTDKAVIPESSANDLSSVAMTACTKVAYEIADSPAKSTATACKFSDASNYINVEFSFEADESIATGSNRHYVNFWDDPRTPPPPTIEHYVADYNRLTVDHKQWVTDTVQTTDKSDFTCRNVTCEGLRKLVYSPEYLSDESIACIIDQINAREYHLNAKFDFIRSYICTLDLMRKMFNEEDVRYDFSTVAHYHTYSGLQSNKLVLIPFHTGGNHWAVIAVDFIKKEISSYDSLSWRHDQEMKCVARYLADLSGLHGHLREDLTVVDVMKWPRRNLQCPVQRNAYDCGVFMLLNCLLLTAGSPLAHDQEIITQMRLLFAYYILHGAISDPRLPSQVDTPRYIMYLQNRERSQPETLKVSNDVVSRVKYSLEVGFRKVKAAKGVTVRTHGFVKIDSDKYQELLDKEAQLGQLLALNEELTNMVNLG